MPIASTPSPARQVIAITSATGRAEATRAITTRQRVVCASSASRAGAPEREQRAGERHPQPALRARVLEVHRLARALDVPRVGRDVRDRARRAPCGFRWRPNSRAPNSASSAGTSVAETASEISVVAASPGPNARKNPSSPTASAPVPARRSSPP